MPQQKQKPHNTMWGKKRLLKCFRLIDEVSDAQHGCSHHHRRLGQSNHCRANGNVSDFCNLGFLFDFAKIEQLQSLRVICDGTLPMQWRCWNELRSMDSKSIMSCQIHRYRLQAIRSGPF